MKKIILTFFIFLCFIGVFLFTLVVGLHVSLSDHHNMSVTECLEHCLSGESFLDIPKSLISFVIGEVIILQILFSKVFTFTLPLFLLYILLSHAPPNLFQWIKNYNYSCLVGIIKLTT